jgi:hypothetical protein
MGDFMDGTEAAKAIQYLCDDVDPSDPLYLHLQVIDIFLGQTVASLCPSLGNPFLQFGDRASHAEMEAEFARLRAAGYGQPPLQHQTLRR